MNLFLKILATLALIVIATCAVFFVKAAQKCCCATGGGAPQILAGGVISSPNTSVYSNTWTTADDNLPSTGQGEKSLQLRLPSGTLSKLRVHVTTASPPTSGQAKATVRVNGANTALTCQVASTGDCDSGAASVTLADDDRVVVQLSNNFVGSNTLVTTYTLQLR